MATQPLNAIGDVGELNEALARSRADARAARDEALRLASENETLRALLDKRIAEAEASRTDGGSAQHLSAGVVNGPVDRGDFEELDRLRLETRMARSEAEALRDEISRTRAELSAAKQSSDAATGHLSRQLDEARAESARAAAESREIHSRIDHLLAESTRSRGG